MSKSTISTFELFEMFPSAFGAREHLQAKRIGTRKGISSLQLAKQIGVTQKTAQELADEIAGRLQSIAA